MVQKEYRIKALPADTAVDKIDWTKNLVYFKDGTKSFVVSRSHKKEIESYEFV